MTVKSQRLCLSTVSVLFAASLALAACSSSTPTTGSGTPTTTATSTSTQATDILNHARQAPLKDATFSFVLSGTSSAATATPAPTTSGNGRLTTNPARIDLVFPSIQFQGFSTSGEVIVDQASGTYYVNVAAISSTWLKVNPATVGVNIGVATILDYSGLQNLTYIGTETINGTATWHIEGTKQVTQSGSQGNISVTRTEDYWFRQSDYYPVKISFQDVVNAASGGTGTPSPTGTGSPTATATPSPSPTGAAPSVSTTTATPSPAPSPTVTSTQVLLSETFSFSAWDTGLTIALPTNAVGS